MGVKDRLKRFIAEMKMSQGKFERACGFANGYVNNIRRSISPDKMQSIIEQFPMLSIDWLLTGQGDMFRSENNLPEEKNDVDVNFFQKKIDELQSKYDDLNARYMAACDEVFESGKMNRDLLRMLNEERTARQTAESRLSEFKHSTATQKKYVERTTGKHSDTPSMSAADNLR